MPDKIKNSTQHLGIVYMTIPYTEHIAYPLTQPGIEMCTYLTPHVNNRVYIAL